MRRRKRGPVVAGHVCNVARADNYVTLTPVRDTFVRSIPATKVSICGTART